ncbi:hypothetical protein [Marinicella gelatinilytica]|uniref:hypothetical protein n=1 Tax=Marinicella gelatinilytica TaxID=2996017 RepID=UPI002260EFCA|nr:hypothetical protein [Marinicella gelatinilytica]MCX7545295.1 hypothetical protein [Marinicella gelatinilytica]
MKHLIKIAGLMACSTVFAGDTVYLNSDDLLDMEANAPLGFEINRDGEIISDNTKTMVDENRPVGGTSIRYYSAVGSAMQSSSSGTYSYTYSGCKTPLAGTVQIDDAVDLPNGSKVVSFSAFGVDNSGTAQASSWLVERDNNTNTWTDLETHPSGGSAIPGRFSEGGFLDYTIGYSNPLVVRQRANDSDISLCGYRIGYVPPDVASDVIFVNNFYR